MSSVTSANHFGDKVEIYLSLLHPVVLYYGDEVEIDFSTLHPSLLKFTTYVYGDEVGLGTSILPRNLIYTQLKGSQI